MNTPEKLVVRLGLSAGLGIAVYCSGVYFADHTFDQKAVFSQAELDSCRPFIGHPDQTPTSCGEIMERLSEQANPSLIAVARRRDQQNDADSRYLTKEVGVIFGGASAVAAFVIFGYVDRQLSYNRLAIEAATLSQR